MVAAIVLLGTGAVVLYTGADVAVRWAGRLARAAGLPAFLIGALLFGVDLEGLGTAVIAAAGEQTQIAAGEIFGTVLFLFSAAFGAALLFAPRPVPSPDPVMVVAPSVPMAAAALALYDRFIGRYEGAILVLLYVGYVIFLLKRPREEADAPGEAPGGEEAPSAEEAPGGEEAPSAERIPGQTARAAAATVLGLLILALGAAVLVGGGSRLVEQTSLLPGFVGAAVIGVLASLDEVLLEILPIRRGTPDLATGNLFGTMAAFSSGVLGVTALVRPLDVDGAGNAAFLGMAALYTLVSVVFLLRGRAGRILGVVVLAAYAAWLTVLASV
ncbi:MAG TPA: hypothetical protein VGB28_07245 [Actinomycetota bacterium]|jgi:cation:H+ antiporter